MNPNLTYLVAQQHINDLLREARHVQRSAALRRTRRLTLASTRLRLRRRVIAGIVVAVCGLFVAVPAAGAADFAWSGATTDHRWSNAANWIGGMAPSGSIGTLTFPTLTSPACMSIPPTDACYSSDNNISGLTANALSIDSSGPYTLQGNGITLAAGGLSASVPPGSGGADFVLDFPISLGAAQSWTIGGGSTGAASVQLSQAVSGTADALTAHLAHRAGLDLWATRRLERSTP